MYDDPVRSVAVILFDKAGALYDLTQAYYSAGELDSAERNVLAALEAAPGYRPAQQLLLQIPDAQQRRPK